MFQQSYDTLTLEAEGGSFFEPLDINNATTYHIKQNTNQRQKQSSL